MRHFLRTKRFIIFACLLVAFFSLPAVSLFKDRTHKKTSTKPSYAPSQVLANNKKSTAVAEIKKGTKNPLKETGAEDKSNLVKTSPQALKKSTVQTSPQALKKSTVQTSPQALKKSTKLAGIKRTPKKPGTEDKISSLDSLSLPAISLAQNYQFLLKWGRNGTTDGRFQNPMDVAADSAGNVFVADFFNHRIQKFDNNGGFLGSWGSRGSANGQLYRPEGVCTDVAGNVFVADTSNMRMQKFDNNGNFLLKWNTWNSGSGWFRLPRDCAVDSSGNVFVTDGFSERVVRFDNNGNYDSEWGSGGSENGQFNSVESIAIDSMDNIFVTEAWGYRVQKFDNNGAFITKWGSNGSGSYQFNNPYGIAIDSVDRVLVADTGNNRIQQFTNDGAYVGTIGSGGSADGRFLLPYAIGADSTGNFFVADTGNERIQKFGSASGNIGPNFSFEIDDNSDGIPDKWNPSEFEAGDGRSSDFAQEGDYSLKIAGNSAKLKSVKQRIPTSGNAGDILTFSGWNKNVGGSTAGKCNVALFYFNNADGTRTYAGYLFFFRYSHDWLQVSNTFIAEKDYTSIDITIGYFYQTGTTYFDDFKLLKQ